jgi:NADH-quinone oxidoreductase subunit B
LRLDAPAEYPVPEYGAHDLEPPSNPGVWHPPVLSQEDSR